MVFAPVKMFSSLLLDDENSEDKDGTRTVVRMIKYVGRSIGVRDGGREERTLTDIEENLFVFDMKEDGLDVGVAFDNIESLSKEL